MSAEPSLLQVGQPAPVLQEQVRGGDHVRRGQGARGPPRRVPRLQRLRAELRRGGRARGGQRHRQRGLRVLHLGDGDGALPEGDDRGVRGALPAGGRAGQVGVTHNGTDIRHDHSHNIYSLKFRKYPDYC